MENQQMIFGLRAIIEVIQDGKEIDKIFIQRGLRGELYSELFHLIKEHDVPYALVPIEKLNRFTRKNHQGVVALISAITYHKIEQLLPTLYEQGKTPFILVLDRVTDVRNFGALARTAECAGVDAILIPARGGASINADAIKTSAGALHKIPVCRAQYLQDDLKYLKESGLKIVGVSEKAEKAYYEETYPGPIALVLGSEEDGISQAYIPLLDDFVTIPMLGTIGSLNVSVAGGILMFEVSKQRLNS
ncbi:MAG: 23S rRNA (guanosine(2251)-2'-O)-methyltransferase RlmB [Bacteroidales bacterium]|jgi:23S rRNA (guanosine2251-2'-O)-methyltransferase|nr:23S rRNA (guanosine(2251)-2'-O)-methyltransferase RlmB [Bacteroidales bacterium]